MIKLKSLLTEKAKRDYKDEYKKFQSSPAKRKYRSELNKYNRDKGTYGNGDGKDASHKGGKIAGFESQSKNRGRREKSRLKKEAAYEGNVGVMELVKFYDVADRREKQALQRLMDAKRWPQAWKLVQKVTGTNLKGKQFHEVLSEYDRDPLALQLEREGVRTLSQIARQLARIAMAIESKGN